MSTHDRDELEQSDRTLELLQSVAADAASAETPEGEQVQELGRLLRESVDADLPDVDWELRGQLLEQLNAGTVTQLATGDRAVAEVRTRGGWRRRAAFAALACSLLVAIGLFTWPWEAEDVSRQVVSNVVQGQKDRMLGSSPPTLAPAAIADDKAESSRQSADVEYDWKYVKSDLASVLRTKSGETVIASPADGQTSQSGEKNEVIRGLSNEDRGIIALQDQKIVREKLGVAQERTRVLAERDGSGSVGGQPVADKGMVWLGGDAQQVGLGSSLGLEIPMTQDGYAASLPPNAFPRKQFGSESFELAHQPAARGTVGFGVWNEDDGRTADRLERLDVAMGMGGGGGREQYLPIQENPFVSAVGGQAISTFSIDVDTASYANMRRFLTQGQRPPRDSVRLEELINYFAYDYPQPTGDDPFSVNMELASCPWNDQHRLLRVGLQGKDVHVDERPPTNVVFLLDVSGSMNSDDKLPLLKRGFQQMVKQLNENDRVSIVTYAGNAGVALQPTVGDQTKTINEAIERLASGGSTHGSAGITLAYELAQQNFIQDGVNKVILATDGDLNVGVTDDAELVKLITQKASEGVFLTVLGFGTGNLKDGKLEQLADNGNGLYAYIDSLREAHKVLVQQMSGSLVTIAKDVKIQIEFNPAEVKSYRLLGYENRMLATEDFDNDQKDAGEIGAGHSVTALYEIVTTDHADTLAPATPQGMKYQAAAVVSKPTNEQAKVQLSAAAESGELATIAVRYKQPQASTSKRLEFSIKNQERSFAAASDDFRFAASVAGFGMLLRQSQHLGDATAESIEAIAAGAVGKDHAGYRAEFVDLVRRFGSSR